MRERVGGRGGAYGLHGGQLHCSSSRTFVAARQQCFNFSSRRRLGVPIVREGVRDGAVSRDGIGGGLSGRAACQRWGAPGEMWSEGVHEVGGRAREEGLGSYKFATLAFCDLADLAGASSESARAPFGPAPGPVRGGLWGENVMRLDFLLRFSTLSVACGSFLLNRAGVFLQGSFFLWDHRP